jgi:hypothetical protein
VEPYTPGFDVWSLVQLLEDMRRAAEAFGRSEIGGLLDASDAPSYEGELRDFLVESMWENVGDVDSGADRLRARQIKEDIKGLRDATEDVKRYADLVAHNAREKPAPVAFSVISSATDEIVRIAKRYMAALTGASMLSFALVDAYRFFNRPFAIAGIADTVARTSRLLNPRITSERLALMGVIITRLRCYTEPWMR